MCVMEYFESLSSTMNFISLFMSLTFHEEKKKNIIEQNAYVGGQLIFRLPSMDTTIDQS